jgi:hypothetical protein
VSDTSATQRHFHLAHSFIIRRYLWPNTRSSRYQLMNKYLVLSHKLLRGIFFCVVMSRSVTTQRGVPYKYTSLVRLYTTLMNDSAGFVVQLVFFVISLRAAYTRFESALHHICSSAYT